jgi:L-amino acid N-acyltransferase YncA
VKKGLLRVLHVRRLLEERTSLELQARSAELRRLEGAAEEQRRLAAATRSDALRQMLAEDATDACLGMADAEIFSWKRRRMETAAQKVSEEVVEVRERMRSRRVETKQAAALVSEAEETEKREWNRREQQRLDDSFQSHSSPGSRHSR